MRVRPLLGIVTLIAVGLVAVPASADGPGVGAPYVVSVGDSYISGEAGRWAGNTNTGEQYHDAGGAAAYFDNASHTAEAITRCHRSTSAEVFIGVAAVNLACSGAQTSTFVDSDGNFKPGLDFYSGSQGVGQASALQSFASTHNVKAVTVSIGGNNFGFAGIIQSCVADFLSSPTWYKDYCQDDSSVTANFTSANVTAQTTAIKNGLLNLRTAMRNAGYADGSWSLVVQTYESPLPGGSGIRYGESGYGRQNTGGCGFWNSDADWANNSALPTINTAVKNAATQAAITNTKVLDLSSAFNGRRLCESTVGLLEEKGLTYWYQSGASDVTEWVNQIRTVSTCCGSNYYIQESFHPNYWGQLALRNCLRQVWNGGAIKAGKCTRGANGKNSYGEPNMVLS
ncbi:MAG: hypothetical protein JWN31_1887 [Frankiales bacterium]|nr:hypothetical protein [Frankiales bacterium]